VVFRVRFGDEPFTAQPLDPIGDEFAHRSSGLARHRAKRLVRTLRHAHEWTGLATDRHVDRTVYRRGSGPRSAGRLNGDEAGSKSEQRAKPAQLEAEKEVLSRGAALP